MAIEWKYPIQESPIVDVDRFIDGYRSRNERLAALMRRFRVCEEIGSGIDKVVGAAETHQLPARIFGQWFCMAAARSFRRAARRVRTERCGGLCWLQESYTADFGRSVSHDSGPRTARTRGATTSQQ